MNIEKFIKNSSDEDTISPRLANEVKEIFADIDGMLVDCGIWDHKRSLQIVFEMDGRNHTLILRSPKKVMDLEMIPQYLADMKSNYLNGVLNVVI